MAKGISDAQKVKETLWTQSDLDEGTIKEIRLMDAQNQYIGDKRKSAPKYAEVLLDFGDGVTCRIPCTLDEAGEYSIGQKASVELNVSDNDDDD